MTGEDDLVYIKIGIRVVSDGYFGTVLYKGKVPPTQGYWLGIDWDDPSRGKHDGCHEGNRYFTARHPSSGSFVRISKVEFGISCFKAIKERYGQVGGDKHNFAINEVTSNSDIFQIHKPIQYVGFEAISEKQSQFDKLEEVVLHNMKVYGADSDHNLQIIAPRIVELDLSKNLLSSWESVVNIIEQLSCLRLLNLSENKLQLLEGSRKCSKVFSSVKTLVLNRMSYNWSQILICTEIFPSLEELTISCNEISTIEHVTPNIERLKSLALNDNPIENWQQILRLGNLSRLETLNLSDCNLQEIIFNDCAMDGSTELFASLKLLILSNNKINNWTSINHLNKLQNLQELIITKNPFLTLETSETTRQLIIAKLKRLKICNRTIITSKERRGAELDYLKRFGQFWLKAGGHQEQNKDNPSEEFLTEHPQYKWLIQKYGPPEDSELTVQSTSLKSNLINIMIICPEASNINPLTRKIPLTMTVQKLMTLVQRLFKINTQDFKLSYVSAKVTGIEVVLDNVMKEVGYYSIEDGDTLYVRW